MQKLTRFPWPGALWGLLFLTQLARASVDPDVLGRLAFDDERKQYNAKLGEVSAPFVFSLTNTWTNVITVDRVQTSCGCTVATLPANPWHIPAGGHGDVKATVNLVGKAPGLIKKTITFFISAQGEFLGSRVVTVMVDLPKPPAPTALNADERRQAMERAIGDPQLIFKDAKCAECHVKQGINAWGKNLYAADCGICHDSPNRASSVPDLHHLKGPANFAYWKEIIAHGKPHTMMPAFANSEGGPLTDDQVHSIAEYLNTSIPSQAGP